MRLTRMLRSSFRLATCTAIGALAILVIGITVYVHSRPPVSVWHLVHLDQEFTADSGVKSFEDYLALEDRLFAQLDALVYDKVPVGPGQRVNRYSRGSLSDPHRWSPNWNHSFELDAPEPTAGVLLLHGMSDSPYSLRALGERLHAAGVQVVGLRLPGHGTAPSGLTRITWQDMAAAVHLAARHLADEIGARPLYIVGYSNGAALAVDYALKTLEDPNLPKVAKLVLLSPEIGVSPAAALAVWQARLGRWLDVEELEWTDVLPEYDPFKYSSFAVNAGDVVYKLTADIQARITRLTESSQLAGFPPVLAFASVVDATVSTPALVAGLFDRLPPGDHELILFDINRRAEMEPLLTWDPGPLVQALQNDPNHSYTLTLVTNGKHKGPEVIEYRKSPNEPVAETSLGLDWPEDVYSLSHVALPFPPQDSLYGGEPDEASPGLRLGDLALRGERGALQIPASHMLRLRWNPFFSYVESRTLAHLGLK